MLYINGQVLSGSDFVSLLEDYLVKNDKLEDFIIDFVEKNPSVADKYESKEEVLNEIELAKKYKELPIAISEVLNDLDRDSGFDTKYELGFAHESGKGIYIETDNLMNCSLESVASAMKSVFPNCQIYDDNSCYMVSDDPDSYKEITADYIGIDNYIILVDGIVYFGDSYFDALELCMSEKNLTKKYNEYIVKTFLDSKKELFDKAKRFSEFGAILDDVENYFNRKEVAMDMKMAFAKESNNSIFVEPDKVYNMSYAEAVDFLKKEFPDMEIFDISEINEVAASVLKKAYHGLNSREKALVYIDGDVLEGRLHTDLVESYLDKNNYLFEVNKDFIENSDKFSDYTDEEKASLIKELTMAGKISKEMNDAMNEWNRQDDMPDLSGIPVGFAHLSKNKIYIDLYSIQNTDVETVSGAFKDAYPDCSIYTDEDEKQIIAMHDQSNRDCAIMYINGDMIEGQVHPKMVEDWLKQHNILEQTNEEFLEQQGLSDEEKKEELEVANQNKTMVNELDFALSEFGRQEYDLEEVFDFPLAFAHKVGNEIYIISDAICNIGFRDLVRRFKNAYPDCDIYTDEDEELVASVKHLGKRDVQNECAVLVINGLVMEGQSCPILLEKYLREHDFDITKDDCSIAFAHKAEDNKIYLETDTMTNITEQEAINLIKSQYNDCQIFDDNGKQLTANKKQSYHSIHDRDEAILVINGEVITGNYHSDMIIDYLENNNPDAIDEMSPNLIAKDSDIQSACAHKLGNNIYIETKTIENMLESDVANILKSEFPECSIYDNEDDELLVASVQHLGKHGVENREQAILYVEGDVLTGKNHIYLLEKWLADHNDLKSYLEKFYQNIGEDIDSEKIKKRIERCVETNDMPFEVYSMLMEDRRTETGAGDYQLAFAHLNDKKIFLETDTIYNVSKNTVIDALKSQFPDYPIFDDDSCSRSSNDTNDYEKLVALLRL